MTTELTVPQNYSDNLLLTISNAAKDPNVDVEKAERLFALLERMLAKQAEEAFNRAMADAQAEMPRILRDATNPSTSSRYARLESVNREVIPVYTKHGFSLSFGSGDCAIPEHYRITCIVSHRGGHTRPYQCDLPRDDMGAKDNRNKTKMHGVGSTFSYGRRYLTLLIFNVSLVNEDDDGNRGERAKPSGPARAPGPAQAPTDVPGVSQGGGEIAIYAKQLAALLKQIDSKLIDWDSANQWLWREDLLDAAADERAPRLSVEKFKMVLAKVKAKLEAR